MEVIDLSPKMGRPKAENPKHIKFSIRLDEKTDEALLKYCEENNIVKAEAIRQGIYLLLDQNKK